MSEIGSRSQLDSVGGEEEGEASESVYTDEEES